MTMDELIRAVQAKLGLDVDGQAGPQTWSAIYDRIVGQPVPGTPALAAAPLADSRSEQNIATLLPPVQPLARTLIAAAAAAGIVIKVISGTRSYAEQDDLYEQGRTKPGSIVTNARGGYSNHNFGIAFDVGVFEGGRYIEESPAYKTVGALGKKLGLEWGGDWQTIVDEPHFELRPVWAREMSEGRMLAELRARKVDGREVFA